MSSIANGSESSTIFFIGSYARKFADFRIIFVFPQTKGGGAILGHTSPGHWPKIRKIVGH